MPTDSEFRHLQRCIELAVEALEGGDEPFGSVLVGSDGAVLAEGRNRVVSTGDQTRHPEFELARWAAANMTAKERSAATVYTSGDVNANEVCPHFIDSDCPVFVSLPSSFLWVSRSSVMPLA